MAEIDDYIEAGKIARQVAEDSKKLIKVGASLFDTAETIEKWIKEKTADKGGVAFPVNISINEQASHFTPSFNDKQVFEQKDLVTVDIGVHINGYVGDIAYTIDLSGENSKIVEASEKALQNALSVVKAGVEVGKIGAEVERTITGYGFKPIRNLSGHGLEQYNIHAQPNIPNIKSENSVILKEEMIIAIEPFASNGNGFVKEDKRVEIFSYAGDIALRNMHARKIASFVKQNYNTLPFAERWLNREFDTFKLKIALRELMQRNVFHSYPILKDMKGSLVSQAEVTLLVEKDSCKVLS